MLKKLVAVIVLLVNTSSCFAVKLHETTPFKVMSAEIPVIADIVNFAYNCVSMDDGSIVYDVIPNSYSTKGSMIVSVYCQLDKKKIVFPLSLQDGVISAPAAIYPVNFTGNVPASCKEVSTLIVTKDPNYTRGYIIQLK